MKVIVDSNIIFSALLKKENKFRNKLLLDEKDDFYTCHFLIIELFKYKNKIVELSKIEEEELLEVFYELLKNIKLYNESLIDKNKYKKSYDLCKDIDKKDVPFVALALELDGYLWTGDKKLKKQLSSKGFLRFYDI